MRKWYGALFVAVALFVQTGVVFSAEDMQEVKTYTVSGTLSGQDIRHLDDASIRIQGDGLDESTETMGSGEFAFLDVPDGAYTLTPSLYGHFFVPSSLDVTVNGLDVTIENFDAFHGDGTFYDVTVLIVDSDGNPMQDIDVTISGNGEENTDLSYKDGTVTFEELANTLSYEISFSLDEWTFDPESITVTIEGANYETDLITATRDVVGYIVSGNVVDADGNGIEGVDIELKSIEGKDFFETVSSADGSYTFEDVPENSYLIVSAHDEYSFEPEAAELMVDRADYTADDFVGTKK